ncbi:hypothetical protein K2173_027214 [Erythroxylum novogranatense]|uniref:Uncharacterized protein n=1 Tax=Erythroxylum novogranatense TaxID=1862640 RepID=A0AAV8TYN4_9ROSI|nr:hypothetical protein K2173_027214 [Erythroxylum novogranatense]
MGRGGRVNCRPNFKKGIRSKDKGSDDSDEDYVVEDEENASDDESADLVDSLDGYASEESFDAFNVVEEEEDDEELKKVARSKRSKGSIQNGKVGGKSSRKRKSLYEEDEDYIDDGDDNVENDDDDDDEFTIDEDDEGFDEDDELGVRKKNNNVKIGKRTRKHRVSETNRKKRRRSRASKKPSTNKRKQNRRLKKKERCEYDDEGEGDFVDDYSFVGERSKRNLCGGRNKLVVDSDSEFLPSGSSDYEYTISEEEREQVREAGELCGDLKTSLRSSSTMKRIEENGDSYQQMKPPVGKGKEKVKEERPVLGKQVCGICLSEEDKRRFRGTLDCCIHYFCFACIMAWSKVESRCPFCKKRFTTITKNGKSTVGVELRNLVIQVPKRDQVYQPSEEEIRSFVDPYENVICTECHEGGDDGLMLLCDLCDSPAHTYCVGLGRQVPEGNWYCDGCRPVALGSSSSQAQGAFVDETASSNRVNSVPMVHMGEGIEPLAKSSPCAVFTHGLGNLPSPRFLSSDVQATSPVSGAGAPTLSVRRQIHRHIQNLLSINRMSQMIRPEGIMAANFRSDLSRSHIDHGREYIQNRTEEMRASQPTLVEERIRANDNPSSSLQGRDLFPCRTSQLRRENVQESATAIIEDSVNLTLWPEHTGVDLLCGYEHVLRCNNGSSFGSEGNVSPCKAQEESQFYMVKEKLQSVVKNHLKILSQDTELGHHTFKDIARSSTHTILAACGLEHRRSEVHTVPLPPPCSHRDAVSIGELSLMKGFCSSCFDSFVRDVVKRILDTRPPQWLSLGL